MSSNLCFLLFHDRKQAKQCIGSANSINDFDPEDYEQALKMCGTPGFHSQHILLEDLVALDVDHQYASVALMSAIQNQKTDLVQKLLRDATPLITMDHLQMAVSAVTDDDDDYLYDEDDDDDDDYMEQVHLRQRHILEMLLERRPTKFQSSWLLYSVFHHHQRCDLFEAIYPLADNTQPPPSCSDGQLKRWEEWSTHAKNARTKKLLTQETAQALDERQPSALKKI